MIEPKPQAPQTPTASISAETGNDGARVSVAGGQNSALQEEVMALRQTVSELREQLRRSQLQEQHAHHLALHDELTALPNRRYFLGRLRLALQSQDSTSTHLAVIYLDLDGFKALNDAHGHDAGDQLLNLVAARLSGAARAEDLVSRLSGDEFACLVPGVAGHEPLQRIATTLFEAVAVPFELGAGKFNVYPSIGIAQYPHDGTTAEALMHAADVAMYTAKRQRATRSHPRAKWRTVRRVRRE